LVEKDVRGFFEIPSETQWVIHAAASSDSRVHYSDPLSVIDTIVHGTSHVLAESSRLNNLKGLLHLSSALVYGSQPLDLPTIDENQFGPLNCGTPRAAYPEAKRQSESLCHAYRSQYRIPVVTARPFAFIGPYQDLDQPYAINNFMSEGLRGEALRILGDENTVRSYLYPSDMAWWVLNMLVRGESGESFNLGSSDGRSIRQIAEEVAQYFNKKSPIVGGNSAGGSPRTRWVPDLKKGSSQLGLKVTVGFEEAIQRTVQWFQS
jgi:dTDP-glucose 4,6-dehydratase